MTVLAPPVANSRKGDGLGKEDFEIDFDAMRATCPGGVTTGNWKLAKEGNEETTMYTWSKEPSAECTCAEVCPVHRGRRRHLKLHPLERELRAIREDWAKPETRRRYRRRTEGERLMREMTRRGARRAGAWGLDNASLQAHCAGGVHNLRLLARRLAAEPEATTQAA